MSDPLDLRLASASPPPSCIACSTGRLTSWSMLDSMELESLQRLKTYSHFHPNQSVYVYGKPCEALYCVASGTVAEEPESASPESRRLHLREAGDTLGWADFFGGGSHQTRAVCLSEATICAVPAEVVRGLIHRNPLLGLKFLGQATRETMNSECMSWAESRADARCRLSTALRSLARHSGSRIATGETRVALPLSRRVLADLIAVSPESMAWAIRDLEESGRAHFTGRTVWINNPDRLPVDIRRETESAA